MALASASIADVALADIYLCLNWGPEIAVQNALSAVI